MDIIFFNYIKSVLKMLSGFSLNIKMVQALTILSALQLFSEGVPGAEGSGEPYGISRGVVEGAVRAGSVLNPQNPREFDLHPGVPALNQVSPTSAPSSLDSSSSNNGNWPMSSQGEAQKPDMPACNRGQGVLRYERLSDVQLVRSSSDTDIVRLSEIPADVTFKCQDFCLKDRTSQNLPQLCGSFDFVPGKRFSSKVEYTESKCFLAMPDDTPGKLPQYKIAKDYYHYREVCYAGDGNDKPTVATDCPERLYVMERVMGKRFMPKGAREVNANSLEECQQMCLNQATEDPLMATTICRSGTFDHRRARCYLSTYTRRTHPMEFIDDSIFDYFENTCLDVERRCPEGKLFWTKEVNAEMIGPYDTLLYQNVTVDECKGKCLANSNIYCRSVEYDERSKTCVLSDEDSMSRPEHIRQSLSDQNIYLELTCIDGYNMEAVNSLLPASETSRDRQPLSDRNLRKVQTAFQLFRKRRLDLSPGFRERGREGTKVSLAECLDACLEEKSFQCRSAIYSTSRELCRLSEFDRINGNLAMDLEYDYFENLMKGPYNLDHNFGGGLARLPGSGSYGASYNKYDKYDYNRPDYDSRPPGFISDGYDTDRHSFGIGSRPGPGLGVVDTRPFPPHPGSLDFGSGNSLFDFGSGTGHGSGSHGSGSSGFGSGSLGTFEPVGSRLRLRSQYIQKYFTVSSLNECKEECLRERSFTCRSFNYRDFTSPNCEVSDVMADSGDPRQYSMFDRQTTFKYYMKINEDLVDLNVSQQCNPDGSMEFMLRTADAFRGRIYTFGYYDKCFYRGGGSTVNILKISPPRGFPSCGTSRYGDTTTNIVVVQFADGVMTSKDKRYNLTCTTVGPGDTVVTSAYIGAGIGAPIPIEYLPEETRLDSQVQLRILYDGRQTTTVAVGDPLTFRIDSLAGRGLVSDIFASDVIARDILTGRAIELIDNRGCPVQEEIFPALGKARSGDGLEARFSAFKIPESNMIVFEARVRMCRRECEPAICASGRGRAEIYSFGRKRRSADEQEFDPSNLIQGKNENSSSSTLEPPPAAEFEDYDPKDLFSEEEAKVNEVLRVYMNEEEAEEFRSVEAAELISGVCVSPSEYYSLLAGLMVTGLCLLASLFVMALCFRKHKKLEEKNAVADESNPHKQKRSGFPGSHPRTVNQPARYFPSIEDKSQANFDLNGRPSRGNRFADPSEPIYTDPNLFERSPKEPGTSSVKL